MPDNCEISIVSSLNLLLPQGFNWREDTLIPTVQLSGPSPNINICKEATESQLEDYPFIQPGPPVGYTGTTFPPTQLNPVNQNNEPKIQNTQICLSWYPVAEATVYLLQWSLDQSFDGPSVQERILPSGYTSYCLHTFTDIRQGEEIFWRVFAANKNTGGVSNSSEVRKLSYDCKDNDSGGSGYDKCNKYSITSKIKGSPVLKCCDFGTYWLELSAECTNVYGQTLIQVADVEWTASGPSGDDVAQIQPFKDGNVYKTGLKICAQETQVAEICCKITFLDLTDGTTFECSPDCLNVLAECGDPDDTKYYPFIKEKYISEKRGSLEVCGEDLSVKDCNACQPCCEEGKILPICDYLQVTCENIATKNVGFNPETCLLSYDLEFYLPTSSTLVQYHEVAKGEGKSVVSTPTDENEDYWIFQQYPDEPLLLKLKYEGCWEYDSKPYFEILYTPINIDEEIENEDPETFKVGFHFKCSGPLIEKSTKYANFSGPVHYVDDYKCSDEAWPDCNECSCQRDRVKVRLNDKWHHLKYPDGLETFSEILKIDCECNDCIDGRLEAYLEFLQHDDLCNESIFTLVFELYCKDTLMQTFREEVRFPCESMSDYEDNTTTTSGGTTTTYQPTELNQVIELEYCGCLFEVEVASVSGRYDIVDEKPCKCIQEELNICVTKDGFDAKCISGFKRVNGEWQLPLKKGVTEADYEETPYPHQYDNAVIIDERQFAVTDLYFKECKLFAYLCSTSSECSTNSGLLCDCGENCLSGIKEFEVTLTYSYDGGAATILAVTFSLDETTGQFVSETVTLSTDTDGYTIAGRFYLTGQAAVSNAIFIPNNVKRNAISEESSVLDLTCGATTATLDSNGEFTLTYQKTLVPSNPDNEGEHTYVFDLFGVLDYSECACEGVEFEFDIDQCLPLKASKKETFTFGDVTLEIGNTVLEDKCGCPKSNALEAIINFPYGCGFKTEVDKDNPEQMFLGIDYDTLVGSGEVNKTLDVLQDDGCPYISLPLCGCVNFKLYEDGNPDMKEPKRFLHSGVAYKFTAQENISKAATGKVKLLDFDEASEHYYAEQEAVNLTAFDIEEGDFGIMLVTKDCNKVLVALDTVSTSDDLTDTERILATACPGSCKYVWDAYLKDWELVIDGCTPTTTTEEPTTTTCFPEEDTHPNACSLLCIPEGIAAETSVYDSRYEKQYSNCKKGYICDISYFGSECPEQGYVDIPCVIDPEGTTTTEAPVNGGCVYECKDLGPEHTYYQWENISSDCVGGYRCPDSIDDPELHHCYVLGEKITKECILPKCRCSKPNYCGEFDGQCVYPPCFPGAMEELGEINCDTTSTTPDGGTTTTQEPYDKDEIVDCCDEGRVVPLTKEECCNRNGTINIPCIAGCGKCRWREVPHNFASGGIFWKLIENGCGEDCFCEPPVNPEDPPIGCNTECRELLEAETPCTKPSLNPSCTGGWDYMWSCYTQRWYRLGGRRCEGIDLAEDCDCTLGDIEQQLEEAKPDNPLETFKCVNIGCRVTCDTDDISSPCPPEEDETETAITPNPCASGCVWRGKTTGVIGVFDWELYENNCPEECENCYEPDIIAKDVCHYVKTDCSSVTTTPGPSGNCCYYDGDKFVCTEDVTELECKGLVVDWPPTPEGWNMYGHCWNEGDAIGCAEIDTDPSPADGICTNYCAKGACCIAGECSRKYESVCLGLGGVFLGPGTICENVEECTTTTTTICPCPESIDILIDLPCDGFNNSLTVPANKGVGDVYTYSDTTGCGDLITASLKCDPTKEGTDADRWTDPTLTMACATEIEIGTIKTQGDCDTPHIWNLTGDFSGCDCCDCSCIDLPRSGVTHGIAVDGGGVDRPYTVTYTFSGNTKCCGDTANYQVTFDYSISWDGGYTPVQPSPYTIISQIYWASGGGIAGDSNTAKEGQTVVSSLICPDDFDARIIINLGNGNSTTHYYNVGAITDC